MDIDTIEDKKYTDSIFYETFLTGKYIKKIGEQLFCKLNFDFSAEEFAAMDFLYQSSGICQRDLAVKMLVDRANMGKILNSLEKKGIVKRVLALKGNRPVKMVNLTKIGEEAYVDIVEELRTLLNDITDEITENDVEVISLGLSKIRGVLGKLLKIDI